jgi:hypothetical protein
MPPDQVHHWLQSADRAGPPGLDYQQRHCQGEAVITAKQRTTWKPAMTADTGVRLHSCPHRSCPATPHTQERSPWPSTETGEVTGTKDKDYNLIWYIEACLNNTLRIETYIQDAERENDTELTELFRKAQADSRKGAQLGKRLLRTRLGG